MLAKVIFKKIWKDDELLERSTKIFINERVLEQKDIERVKNNYRLEIKRVSEKEEEKEREGKGRREREKKKRGEERKEKEKERERGEKGREEERG